MAILGAQTLHLYLHVSSKVFGPYCSLSVENLLRYFSLIHIFLKREGKDLITNALDEIVSSLYDIICVVYHFIWKYCICIRF